MLCFLIACKVLDYSNIILKDTVNFGRSVIVLKSVLF